MALYKFYDSDLAGARLYDICGTRYKRLLEACFRYSASVAMCVPVDANIDLLPIASFQRKVTPPVKAQYAYYGSFAENDMDQTNTYRLVRYLLAPDVKRFIMNRTDSMFKWSCARGNENPEDLAFFRPDGTVFFSLHTREGICTLNPEEGEDISQILKDHRWQEV